MTRRKLEEWEQDQHGGVLRSWPPCDARLIGQAPHGYWQTCAVIAALRHDRVEAAWLL